ncbi:MAG: TonB-dependent receptor [Gammaproteobacteria bacterium]|nr:TonB-dependent receptor [Gammaproteobacteria bacterium]
MDAEIIRQEIAAGRYDLADPLSGDADHLRAIERSSLREEEDFGGRYLGARLALEGAGPGIGGRASAWTAGVELARFERHRQLAFRARDGQTRDVTGVLGSAGTSYAGERDEAGAFAEVSLPIADTVDVRAAARTDEYDDVGGLRAWRLGTEYRPSDIVTLRGSWSAGDEAPSMYHLHSTVAQGFPFVRCIPESGPPPRTCDTANWVQVERLASGNPELGPSRSERRSIGAEARRGPFYLVADWYRLTTSELPGLRDATWAMLNHPECPPGGGSDCIERTAGDVTIHDSFANIVETEISGVNTRFGARMETGWGFVALRGFWRYVADSEERIAGDKQPLPLPRNAVRIEASAGRGDVTAFWAINYRDEIENRWDEGRFKSWTGHDVTLDWREPLGLESTRVTAGVYNVTDAKLSTNTADPSATDGPRAAGWGRTFFVTLNMRF